MELPGEGYRIQVVDILRDLVRIDTTNPPGNEIEAARYLAHLLEPAGIETRIVESAPGRGNLIARLRGVGAGKPLLLMGHLDVVSANRSEWRYPPFSGEVHDGFVWGRGTTDMKDMVAISAVILLALAGLGRPLQRDILFIASADEERGGRYGMGWLVKNMPAILDVACALNEGGGSAVQVGGKLFFTCQSAEKGLCRAAVTARGRGGHASHPHQDIATLRLCRSLVRLGDGYLAGRASNTMSVALQTIAAAQSDQAAARTASLLAQGRIIDALLAAGFDSQGIEHYRALFYDTVSVTGLRAGDPQSINVIPATATGYVDGRILPGQTRDGFERLLRQALGDEVDVQILPEQSGPGVESACDAPICGTMATVMAERCDGATVIPWQCAGATDARHLIPLGIPVYGFVPARPLPEGIEDAGAHADNERLWLGNLHFSLEVLYDIVYRFCAAA
jgi:acetylornithine deacetylase/succinyl-diaminopimelate desuccinylase-like protein